MFTCSSVPLKSILWLKSLRLSFKHTAWTRNRYSTSGDTGVMTASLSTHTQTRCYIYSTYTSGFHMKSQSVMWRCVITWRVQSKHKRRVVETRSHTLWSVTSPDRGLEDEGEQLVLPSFTRRQHLSSQVISIENRQSLSVSPSHNIHYHLKHLWAAQLGHKDSGIQGVRHWFIFKGCLYNVRLYQ